MRQFSLINAVGDVYRLNSFEYFFHDPEGMGFVRNATYRKIGNNYEIIQDSFDQTPKRGKIMFKSTPTISAYKRYLKFSNFLQEIPLTLVYQIPGGEFLLTCIPGTIEKTEINSAFGMDVGIELIPLSMWYKEIKETSSTGGVIVRSDSKVESPCCLSFTGLTKTNESLSWSQELNGVEIMTGELDGVTIASTDTVIIRTDTNPYQIYKISSEDVKTDLYGKSDFATKRFPLLHKGVNEFIVTGASEITIEGRILHETV